MIIKEKQGISFSVQKILIFGARLQTASENYLSAYDALRDESDYVEQNQQKQKEEWLRKQSNTVNYSVYNDNIYTEQVSPENEIWAGSIIPIALLGQVNSDLPGNIVGQVIQDVYDSYTGMNILIPRGSKVYGSYNSNISWGQERILVVWNRIIRPDAVSLLIGAQGGTTDGSIGLKDKVNYHYGDMASAILVGTGFELALDAARSLFKIPQITQDMTKETIDGIIEKMINQQVTLKIRAGYRSIILLNKDIILPIYKR